MAILFTFEIPFCICIPVVTWPQSYHRVWTRRAVCKDGGGRVGVVACSQACNAGARHVQGRGD
jgi:hypothetical protein